MIVKKYKKKRAPTGNYRGAGATEQVELSSSLNLTIKDPFVFNEEVLYPELHDPRHLETLNKTIYDVLIENLADVIPLGYPSEQFLRWIKQDIHTRLEHTRLQMRNSGYLNPNGQAQNDEEDHYTQAALEKDTGILENDSGLFIELPVTAWGLKSGTAGGSTQIIAKVTDTLFNIYRRQLREGVNLTLRMYSPFPKSGGRSRSRATGSKDEPNLEMNKYGHNPALDRRIAYKYLPVASKGGELQYINVNYLIAHSDFETAYRSDVQRIETKGRMVIQDLDEIRRDDEFNNVETSYRKLRQIMLQRKFETLYRDRIAAEPSDHRRWQGIFEGVDKEKRLVMKNSSIV